VYIAAAHRRVEFHEVVTQCLMSLPEDVLPDGVMSASYADPANEARSPCRASRRKAVQASPAPAPGMGDTP
jgi:hypothetical protein